MLENKNKMNTIQAYMNTWALVGGLCTSIVNNVHYFPMPKAVLAIWLTIVKESILKQAAHATCICLLVLNVKFISWMSSSPKILIA
jgi:hypothetical protein